MKTLKQNINKILDNFPKDKPALPKEYQNIFHDHYKNNRNSKDFVGKMAHRLEKWMHIRVAEDTKKGSRLYSTLEVGAGNLNHLPYEDLSRPYDVVEPYRSLYKESSEKIKIRSFYDDISEVNNKYDRIISIATFEHLINLPFVSSRCGLLLKPGGVLRAAIPAEGGPIWKLAYTLTTAPAFYLRYRLNYEKIMRHEHINNWQEIKAVVEYFFEKVDCIYFGFSPNFSLYHFYQCSEPLIERCLKFKP